MGILVSDQDLAHLRSLYPYLRLESLTTQEEMFLYSYMRGMSMTAAAKSVGMQPARAARFFEEDRTQILMQFIREQFVEDLSVTRETITQMLMEAHHSATNSMEKVACAKELGKLHGLYESDNKRDRAVKGAAAALTGATIDAQRLKAIDDSKLLQQAGQDANALSLAQYEVKRDEPVVAQVEIDEEFLADDPEPDDQESAA